MTERRDFLKTALGTAAGLAAASRVARPLRARAAARPNILWIYLEDTTPLMSCYGNKLLRTPVIDKLAAGGVRFEGAFVPAPVCSACRSGIITGTMQTTFGLHNHRSSRTPESAIGLPDRVKTVPELFAEAGYFTSNRGKTDYNFVTRERKLYTGKGKGPYGCGENAGGRPFFVQLQLKGGKNSGKVAGPMDRNRPDLELPPYYAGCPELREEWAHHYDCVKQADTDLDVILKALQADGLLDGTVVWFFSDHGMRGIRHKQFCYDGGLHVPLVVMWKGNPGKIGPGTVRGDLVNCIDIATTSLALAGLEIPDYMEGRDLFADDFKPREHVIGARDRCDYTIDRIRTVRTKRHRYIRNFMTDRPYMQPQYRDNSAQTRAMKRLYAEGKLNEVQARFMAPERPAEELYDHKTDPHETVNLAEDPRYADVLKAHRGILEEWIRETGDKGQHPEGEAGLKAVMQRWRNRCVNPEYDPIKKKYPELMKPKPRTRRRKKR